MAKKIQKLQAEINSIMLERKAEVEGLMAALLSDTNLLLFGPPGTGKSLMARLACKAFDGTFFEWLVHKFTTDVDIFGPISVKNIEQDVYKKVTTGKLPEAHVAFVDEIFKSSDSVLNSLLTIINERLFHNNGTPTKVPLLTMVGASNELPQGDALAALYDRFILRYWVRPIQDDNSFVSLLSDNSDPEVKTKISLEELEGMKKEVSQIKVSRELLETLREIHNDLIRKKIFPSDRRWKQIVRLLRAFAYLRGEAEVTTNILDVLADMLWNDPKDRKVVVEVISQYANPFRSKALEYQDAAQDVYNLWKTNKEEAEKEGNSKKVTEETIQASSVLREIVKNIKSDVSGHAGPGIEDMEEAATLAKKYQEEIIRFSMGD